MAKRGPKRKAAGGGEHPNGFIEPQGASGADSQSRIEGFAEDLGRVLGTARAKAEGWLGQRQNVAKQLEQIRDTATELLGQLAGRVTRRGRKQAPRGPGKKAMGPRATGSGAFPRRKLSAKAREAISRAQKKRWAKVRAEREV